MSKFYVSIDNKLEEVGKGNSAYDLAVFNGFIGTEQEWLESIKGADGVTPHIGENGNWFIGDSDTGQPAGGSGGNATKNVVSKLTEMNVVVFGDSISDPKVNGMWVKPFKELVTCKSFTNYARGYCTWTFKSDSEYNIADVSNSNVGNNVIWNQFNRLKNDVDNGNVANPDLIIIFAGTNDALQAKTIGDADTTFVSSTQGDITALTNLIDSIRYVCDAIYSKYPDTNVVLCTPLPLAQGQYAQCVKVHDAIVKCAERMGLYYIDATYESGIAWYREKLSPTYYTSGGVHMTNKGGERVAKFLYDALTNLFGYVTGTSGGSAGGDEPSTDTVDKTALNTAITTANNDLSSVLISEDGTDILTTSQWVTQSVYDAFNSAIATATAEYNSEESTQATVETARTDLIFAKETFDNAKAYGTKTSGDDPVTDTGIATIDGVDYDISAANDYPYKMIVNVSGNKRLYASNNRFYMQSSNNTECMTADSYYTSFTNNKANALTKVQTGNAIDDTYDPPYYKIGSNRSIENYLWVNHDLYYYGTENVAVNKSI